MVPAVPMTRTWYNPNQETAAFMVLSMMALAAMLVGVICPAASIVRERERGTMEQLLVTPIRVGEMFVAKTVPTLLVNLLAIAPALVVVRLFDVPIRGNLVTFVVLAAVFQLSAIAFGVFIASISRTLQQALLLAFFGLFPVMFLSGTFTPIESMPAFLQTVSLASPLRYFMDIVLGVFLKGAGWAELWPQAAALALIGSVLFSLSLLVFRRRVG
jgi:ABC-2 type transport system permease protein